MGFLLVVIFCIPMGEDSKKRGGAFNYASPYSDKEYKPLTHGFGRSESQSPQSVAPILPKAMQKYYNFLKPQQNW